MQKKMRFLSVSYTHLENLLKELKACADMVDMLDAKMFSLNEAITAFAKEQREDRNQEKTEEEFQ